MFSIYTYARLAFMAWRVLSCYNFFALFRG